jgi:transaldolase/glucose-6-phosphate isomerase
MTAAYEASGTLAIPAPLASYDGVSVYADARNAATLGGVKTLAETLKLHIAQLGAKDYFALLAYIELSDAHEATINAMRAKVRDAKKVATVMGFGPRYLHSTGQAYKGGPNEGVFITITADHRDTIGLANRRLDFATVQLAQAIGDFDVLNERGRRAIRIHFKDIDPGLAMLGDALNQALT